MWHKKTFKKMLKFVNCQENTETQYQPSFKENLRLICSVCLVSTEQRNQDI